MRGGDNRIGELFSNVDFEARVRRDHPLRAIRTIVNQALGALEGVARNMRQMAWSIACVACPVVDPDNDRRNKTRAAASPQGVVAHRQHQPLGDARSFA